MVSFGSVVVSVGRGRVSFSFAAMTVASPSNTISLRWFTHCV